MERYEVLIKPSAVKGIKRIATKKHRQWVIDQTCTVDAPVDQRTRASRASTSVTTPGCTFSGSRSGSYPFRSMRNS